LWCNEAASERYMHWLPCWVSLCIVGQMNYQVQRHKLLKIMAVSAAAPVLRGQSASTADQLKFFEPYQERMVDRLSEMIIPTDGHSPGASGAQVSLFIDERLADSTEEDQAAWTAGLIAVETEARSRFSAPFLDCSEGQQDEILAEMALNEKPPETDLQRFFGVLKVRTITNLDRWVRTPVLE
jgi:hypothetical protein